MNTNDDIVFTMNGKTVRLDGNRIAELAASLTDQEGVDPLEQLGAAFAASKLVEWGPPVEPEPLA